MSKLSNVMTGLSFGLVLILSQAGASDVLSSPEQTNNASGGLDYANAIPMDMRATFSEAAVKRLTEPVSFGEPGVSPGAKGTGEKLHERLGKVGTTVSTQNVAVPSEHGTANRPYATTRVDMFGQRLSRKEPNRFTGKLYFKKGTDTYVCSASSIKKGIVVTAAHCIYDNDADRFHSEWVFIPAFYADSKVGLKAPYGKYKVLKAWVPSAYANPIDNIVNDYDVGVLVMKKRPNPDTGTNMFPGERTGYYGYGWNGWGYTNELNDGSIGLIHQLGYPVSHDNGWQMQANDSQGEKLTVNLGGGNTASAIMIGSRETGGSSGGPWLLNYGQIGALSGTNAGTFPNNNIVVAVTSWGWGSDDPKEQGASPFTDTNIKLIVDAACSDTPDRCE